LRIEVPIPSKVSPDASDPGSNWVTGAAESDVRLTVLSTESENVGLVHTAVPLSVI
jgi:uncharacterized membrane protein